MVSIILPTKNEESCIGATISKILEVCHNPRIVVVDGNSTDGNVRFVQQVIAFDEPGTDIGLPGPFGIQKHIWAIGDYFS